MEFIELDVKINMIMKNAKRMEYTNFKDTLIECKFLFCNKNYQKELEKKKKKLKKCFFNTYKFSNHGINMVFYYNKNLFTHTNILTIGKSSIKFCYLKKIIFTGTQIWKILLMQIKHMQKEFVKILNSEI